MTGMGRGLFAFALGLAASAAAAQDFEVPADPVAAIEGRWTGQYQSQSYEAEIRDGVVTVVKHNANGYPRVPLGTVVARLNNDGKREPRMFRFTGSSCYVWEWQQSPYWAPCLVTTLSVYKDTYSLSVGGMSLQIPRTGAKTKASPAESSPRAPAKTASEESVEAPTADARKINRAAKDAQWEAQLREHARRKAEYEEQLAARERAIADQASRHAASKAAADAELARHQAEIDRHAEIEREAAARRAEWAQKVAGLSGGVNPEEERVTFREGVVLCRQLSPTAKSFSCQGPLQNVSTPLDSPGMQTALGQACGSGLSIRDLGMVAGYRAFGCGFGIHPTARDYPGNTDVPAKLGIETIPGRASYICAKSKLAYCRG